MGSHASGLPKLKRSHRERSSAATTTVPAAPSGCHPQQNSDNDCDTGTGAGNDASGCDEYGSREHSDHGKGANNNCFHFP